MSTPPIPAVPPVPPADGKTGRLSCAILVFLLLAGGSGAVYLFWSFLTPGWFHADRMNAIVEAVRRFPVGEEEVHFTIKDLSRPETLAQSDLQHSGNVWAYRRNGVLQVAIMTQNSGHPGEYGFVFSEVPLIARERAGDQAPYEIPGPMKYLRGKVNAQWCEVANPER